MSGFTSAGTPITSRVVFNSGYIDFGNNRLVQVESVGITLDWSTSPLQVLNSIKPQDLVRFGQKVTVDGKVMSFAPEMEEQAWGSSTIATPSEIDTLDGQPTLLSPVLTVFDRNGKEVQYQLSGAIFKSSKMTSSKENYASWEFTIEAKDIALLYTA